MDLRHYEVFNKLCELKSFSKTAEALFISQSTVSSYINLIEKEMGIRLFKGNKKSTGELTEVGHIFLQYSSQIVALANESKKTIKNYNKGLSGSISIGISPTLCYYNIPKLLEKFNRKFPLVEIVLFAEISPKIIHMLNSKEIQIGIIRNSTDIVSDPKFNAKCIGIDNFVFVFSPNNKINRMNSIAIEDLIKEPLIAYGKNTNFWPQIQGLYNRFGVSPKIIMELNDIYAVKQMAKLGTGVAILPEISVQDELKQGLLVKADINDYVPIKRYSLLIYRKDQILTKQMQNFIRFMSASQ
ncbi:LysR family transcriptional regulator [Neobacillus bataviensis LMG 21833]|uniref:LysR family transcriptional regulator n=1 Tax=Neobacillus bataviensis LMG 21833 TaxID=1117379 RepID=K6DFS8_9BACI|nr:LysR family transcriptional regulator [Neobacillus bataviensis]EKN66938.1 LysR family transcriptional regulator [Neobacillus bataviensis LMG 21833]